MTAAAVSLEVPVGLRVTLREVAAMDARETLRRASRLVSRRVGILRAVGPGVTYAQDPAVFSAGTVSSQLSFSQRIANPSKAGGAGETSPFVYALLPFGLIITLYVVWRSRANLRAEAIATSNR